MSESVIAPDDTTKLHSVDWRENLKKVAPEYVANWDEFKNADSPEKFFDQIKNHRSMLGQSVRIPSQDAGPEQMAEFYRKIQTKVPGLMRTPDPDDDDQVRDALAKIGAPEKMEDYVTDAQLDPEMLGFHKSVAHEAGLTKKQFNALTKKMAERTQAQTEAQVAAKSADVALLRGEWGQAFEQRVDMCARIAEKTGAPPALVDAIKKGEADSTTMRWLHSLGNQFGKEGLNFSNGAAPVDTPYDIQGKIDDMMGNKTHPYWDAGHPAHKAAVDKMIALRKQLNGVS
jgi:hypothetical protein